MPFACFCREASLIYNFIKQALFIALSCRLAISVGYCGMLGQGLQAYCDCVMPAIFRTVFTTYFVTHPCNVLILPIFLASGYVYVLSLPALTLYPPPKRKMVMIFYIFVNGSLDKTQINTALISQYFPASLSCLWLSTPNPLVAPGHVCNNREWIYYFHFLKCKMYVQQQGSKSGIDSK